jgi:hypothetical protein
MTKIVEEAKRSPIKAGPPPDGHLERLKARTPPTEEDLAWSFAISEEMAPGTPTPLELVALRKKAAADHESAAAAATIRKERRNRGADPETANDWQTRLTPVGEIEVPPTADLLLGYLHPTGHTIVFGDGDTGKGTAADWLAMRLWTELEIKTLIVDFEHNPGEHQSRLSSLGYTESGAIRYYDPDDRPIWEQADDIAAAAQTMGADYVIIDSITFACMADVSTGETTVVQRYKAAITTINLPTLSLAHIPKGSKEPHWPFGSIFWHNAARVTWRIDHLELTEEGGEIPSRKVLMTCCKRNDGRKPARKALEIIYAAGPIGLPLAIEESNYGVTIAARFLQILSTAGAALTSAEIASRYNASLDPDDMNAKRLEAKAVGKEMTRHTRTTARKPAIFTRIDDRWGPA